MEIITVAFVGTRGGFREMALILYCRSCFEGIRHQGGELPHACPRCKVIDADWITREEVPQPKSEYKLTPIDARFLRAGGIDPEEPPLLVES